MFNKNLITKKVKLVGNAELEVWFDKEKGTFGSKVVGYGVANAGRAFECKACGKAVVDNDYYNDMRFCPDCLNELKRQLMPKGEPAKLEEKPKKRGADKAKRNYVSKVVSKYKVEIVVPTIQEYLDVLDGMRGVRSDYGSRRARKIVLMFLDMISKGYDIDKMAEVTSLNKHTIYCYFLDLRKVNLVTTKDNINFNIVPPYHHKSVEVEG